MIQWTENYTGFDSVGVLHLTCTCLCYWVYEFGFYSCEIERDRHYAKWKKAVKRTMKWEVNDDEDQGKKIWSNYNSIYHHNCMFVFTLVCLLCYCTVTWKFIDSRLYKVATLGGHYLWVDKKNISNFNSCFTPIYGKPFPWNNLVVLLVLLLSYFIYIFSFW